MLRALWAALVFEWRYGSWSDLWFRAHGMFLTWWRSLGKTQDPRITEQRLAACRKCPIYCADRQTCGDALTPEWLGEGVPMGCFCYLPAKAKLPAAVCWLDEQNVEGIRWPE